MIIRSVLIAEIMMVYILLLQSNHDWNDQEILVQISAKICKMLPERFRIIVQASRKPQRLQNV